MTTLMKRFNGIILNVLKESLLTSPLVNDASLIMDSFLNGRCHFTFVASVTSKDG